MRAAEHAESREKNEEDDKDDSDNKKEKEKWDVAKVPGPATDVVIDTDEEAGD